MKNVILTSFKKTIKLLLLFNMRIEQLCDLYREIHFAGARALPGLAAEMGAASGSGVTVY